MAVKKTYTPDVQWDQVEFEAMRAGWSAQRLAEDDAIIKKLFKLSAQSPLLAEALKWAEKHGVKFFIDRTVGGCGGYYTPGTGIIAISARDLMAPRELVNTLVHEIRHAWQDYHGLYVSEPGEFREEFIKTSLQEADAYAFGEMAERQWMFASARKQGFLPRSYRGLAMEKREVLANNFMSWFTSPPLLQYYGELATRDYQISYDAYLARVNGTSPRKNKTRRRPVNKIQLQKPRLEFFGEPEFKVTRLVRHAGVNINNIQDVLQLGVNFSGTKNYLATLQPDILPKVILRPSLADTFWGAATAKQKKLTTELRKAYLRRKLAPENKRKLHPWP